MRTTLSLDDDLYRTTKAVAALRGVTVTSVIEEALRQSLFPGGARGDSGRGPSSRDVPQLPYLDSIGEPQVEVDLTDNSAVLDALDALGKR